VHAGHPRPVEPQAVDGHAVAQRHVRRVEHGRAQHPLEGRPAAREHHELVVARLRRGVVDAVRQAIQQPDLRGAGCEQALEHVGVAVAQQVPQPGQQGVRVAHLGGAAAVPVERLVRRRRQRGGVALEQDDLVPVARERQRRSEPSDACPDHDDPHLRTLTTPSSGHRTRRRNAGQDGGCGCDRPPRVVTC
jgi:hypothetical protein